MNEVVTIGETMALLTPSERFGKIKSSTTLSKQIGGAESNVAIALARLGHETILISRVGNDPFGGEIIDTLNSEGVNTSFVITDNEHRTGLMLKERSVCGDPKVFYYRKNSAASFLDKTDLSEAAIRSSKILHITGVTPALSPTCRETVFEAVKMAKKHRVKISFDPNLRLKLWTIDEARPVILELAKKADYFFPGIQEARLLLNKPELAVEKILEQFLEMGIEQVVVKLGPNGCVTANKSGIFHVKGIDVMEVDSVGAGDGFCGGYLSGVIKGLPPEECAKRANIVGALAVTNLGDYGGYPTKEILETYLEKYY